MAKKDKDILIVHEAKKLDMYEKDPFNLEDRLLGVIHKHLYGKIYHNILHIKCLSVLWVKLENKYMTESLTSKSYVKR